MIVSEPWKRQPAAKGAPCVVVLGMWLTVGIMQPPAMVAL
jgi:hypothetical protein